MISLETYINKPISARKNIALIAHDHRKKDLISWVKNNFDVLSQHTLCGTGTTATLVQNETGLPVKGYNSGPLGGDQQVGSKIVEGEIDILIFFWDPLSAQPHDPDVKALLRIAVLYEIPVANNQATADFLIHSAYINQIYPRTMIDYANRVQDRVTDYNQEIKSIPMREESENE